MAKTKSTENRVDDWVRTKLEHAGVRAHEKHDLPEALTAVFKGGSKTGNKGGGIPDFTLFFENYGTLVVIENKYFLDKHIKLKGEAIDTSAKAVKDYAVNGAIHYARHAINHDDIQDVIAIGISGESTESSGSSRLADNEVNVTAYYVFDPEHEPKEIHVNKNFTDFTLRNFPDFYQKLSISEEDREQILKKNQEDLKKSASELNKLFNDNAVSVENRVTILAGCLLAMMDRPYSDTYGPSRKGLRPEGLRGIPQGEFSDGNTIYKHVEELMNIVREREPKQGRVDMILSCFTPLKVDTDRDIVDEERSVKLTGKNRGVIKDKMSTNKQIFTYIYENVFKFIEKTSHIDHLGAMYSEFLKYALGDGKDNGIVLTPPYATAAMTQMIDVNSDSRVFDPCTGSAGFLVSAMNAMIEDIEKDLDLTDEEKEEAIFSIKYEQLLGVEKDLKMYGLAVTNMILRGDGYSRILKGDSFKLIREAGGDIQQFKPDKALLNPPFSYSENGMPFVYETLEVMEKGGDLAVIIQDSAGTGQATKTNERILAHHTLVASIRMPGDLFIPTAGVQTSIYILEAGTPHDFKKDVLFVDFSDDGYKRTKRGTREIGDPETRYAQLLEIMKYRKPVEGSDIDVILDTISNSGNDWNYTQHKVYDTVATEEDFLAGAAKFMSFELDMILQGKGALVGFPDELLEEVDAELAEEEK